MNLIFVAAATILYPLAIFNFDPPSIPHGTETVTILVHGYLHNRSAWYSLQWHLQKQTELGPVFTLNLGHPFQSIDAYAQKLGQKIAEIQCLAGTKNLHINLIGHSMGGLVCLHYAASNSAETPIQKIITIASPLHGTKSALLAKPFSKSGSEMIPGSQFLIALRKKIQKLKGRAQLYHIGCGKDWVVPPANTYFEGNTYKLFPSMGHVSVLYSPALAKQIFAWLKLQPL